ncbi:DUF4011 domain-containing protein [Nocardioides sp. CPCC 205120]|uniref:DUF4011 domain-containing protein n=1 Tax=Nocardioides sp. CPCC 205120 TaxID=3406462 RepID=UPI003B503D43
MAAALEQIGLLPVLVLVPGHIFIGYWRRDPAGNDGGTPEWYPGAPVVDDLATIRTLVDGGWLGVIETTTLTAGKNVSADQARSSAVAGGLTSGLSRGQVHLIDVAAARRAGVSPLPAVSERADGVTEVVEYRPGGERTVTEVERDEVDFADRERHVDDHPPRYRTWKASLFSLNATNALLNLRANARVQPLVLPAEGLGVLEDRLNQDASFTVRSGFDVPEVWRARDLPNAVLALRGDDADPQDLMDQLRDRTLFVQRMAAGKDGYRPVGPDACFRELRSMANNARTAREERGMNPLFLCIGLLRWEHKPGAPLAEAPLLLVPVHLRPDRGRKTFTLSLDTSQRTTANAALIEWLRREHGLAVPSLDEPATDRAGIDVDGILADVRRAVADRGLPFEIASEARLATLDLTAFRMWQDLDTQGTRFLERPLVRHLVETPTERFEDPVGVATPQGVELEAILDQLETPIPADATQKRAVLWAREGRTFVLQGPPGTGKSQTITNIVAECVLSGMRVLFVAEKGTALAVVQRRLDAIGLGPFTLNLHHEGSNAAAVRSHLRTSLESTVQPDPAATESARRRLRNARFALAEYPTQLHEPNAAGMSAYGAHDELLVLGDGPALPVTATTVAHHADQLEALRELCRDLPRWTAAAGTRPGHPWRLAGSGAGDPFAPDEVAEIVRTLLAETQWARSTGGVVRRLLDAATHPDQLCVLAAGAHDDLPHGAELDAVLEPRWRRTTADALAACRQVLDQAAPRLRGFPPAVVDRDLRAVVAQLDAADASGVFGRGKRRAAALAPLSALAPAGLDVAASEPRVLLTDLVAAQDAAVHVRNVLSTVAGLGPHRPSNPFEPGALDGVQRRLDAVAELTERLRSSDEWSRQVAAATRDGVLAAERAHLAAYAESWDRLCELLVVQVADLDAWRSDDGLVAAVSRHESVWRQHVDHERLLPLQRWCALVGVLEPMRSVGLDEARAQLLEGRLAADVAEEALARGIARASLGERMSAAGLDRFDPVAHDQRVTGYAAAQGEVRRQWVTDGPARLLARRETGGSGHSTGGLARELEKTSRKLGTRAILRKYGAAVQEVTPLFLCSPSSVVDLVDPELLDFDVVVFDEASQITVPEAVGALGRARAAIVVGDSKQMPPTRVVAAQHSDGELEDDEDDVVEDQESILSECELARVPTLALDWHYRSQDEALIAFSNRTYYRNGLSSFPTPTLMSSETGVDFRRVQAGQYFRAGSNQKADLGGGVVAGNNTNPVEALEIVAYVEQMVERAGEGVPSIGVVTFNESQRQLVEDLLVTRAHPGVLRAMDEAHTGRGDALFVKALEQVQGDERDVVLFSVAFSKQANGRIPTNFGPLSNSGGERRLNVAVTRARRRNVVFCSFDPSELDVSGATYNGPRDLKAFLAFAKGQATASPADEDDATRVVLRDRHRDDVAAALRAAGLTVLTDVGMSGFRLDLVVCRTDDPARPLLPVLLDGEGWRARSTVSDRDVLPVEVLENLMGWPTVLRVWWPMWLQNRQQVVDELVRQVATVEESVPLVVEPEAEPVAVWPADVAPPSSELVQEPDATWRVAKIPDAGGWRAPAAVDVVRDAPASEEGPAAPSVPTVSAFVAAHADTVAGRQVLDALPAGWAADLVRTEVLDVIATEGPVEVGRLTRTVARRFDLLKVRAARAGLIAELVPHVSVRSGPLGSFAWPSHLDPAGWAGYRTGAGRPLEEVAPEEIANAMRGLLVGGALSGDDVLRRTAELFGVTRLGAHVRARLAAVLESLGPEAGAKAAPDVGQDR